MPTYAAVDLGATSGRVVNVAIDSERITLDPVHRFPTSTSAGTGRRSALAHGPPSLRGRDRSRPCRRAHPVAVGGDRLVGGRLRAARRRRAAVRPVHAYRSHRTDGVMESVVGRLGRAASTTSPAFSSCRSTPCTNSSHRPPAASSMTRVAAVDGPGSPQQPPLREHDERGHQRKHDPAARRADAPVEHRAVRRARHSTIAVASAPPTRRDARHRSGARCGAASCARRCGRGRGRKSRHRQRNRRHTVGSLPVRRSTSPAARGRSSAANCLHH